MPDNAYFWIPSLSIIEESLGRMKAPVEADAETGMFSGNIDWFEDVYMRITHVQHFLQDANPFLMGLLLAGYRTEYIEIAVTNLLSRPDIYDPPTDTKWLHINFKDSQVKLLTFPYNADEHIRIKILPVNDAIPLVKENHDEPSGDFFTIFDEISPEDIPPEKASFYEEMDKSTAQIFWDRYQDGVLFKTRPGETSPKFYEFRKNIVHQFIMQANSGADYISINVSYSCKTEDFGVANRLLKTVSELVLDSIYWYVLDRLDWAWSAHSRAEEYVYEPENRLPGLLWILNPNFWYLVNNEDRLNGSSFEEEAPLESFPEYDVETAYKLYRTLDESAFNPHVVREDKTLLDSLKKSMAIEEKISFQKGDFFSVQTTKFFLEQQCHSHYREEGYKRFNQLDDTMESLNLYLGVDADYAPRLEASRFYESFEKRLANVPVGLEGEREISRVIRRCARATYIETILHMVNLGVLELRGLDTEEEQSEEEILPYIDACYDDENAGTILLTYVDPTLDGHEYPSIKIHMANQYVSYYSLEDSFSWEFVPEHIVEIPPDLMDNAQRLGLSEAVMMASKLIIVAAPGIEIQNMRAWPTEKSLIEVYRVQSHSLVPEWGEKINIPTMMAPEAISPFDHFDMVNEEYIAPYVVSNLNSDSTLKEQDEALWSQETLDSWYGSAGILKTDSAQTPIVTVKPFKKVGRNGVILKFQSPQSGSKNWRGVLGTAEIEISASDESGNQRFSYDLYPYPTTVRRIVDYSERTKLVDTAEGHKKIKIRDVPVYEDKFKIIKYRLVIYRTSGVEVKIKDSGVGISDVLADIFYYIGYGDPGADNIFDYYEYEGAFKGIPAQGTSLNYDKEGKKVDIEWVELLGEPPHLNLVSQTGQLNWSPDAETDLYAATVWEWGQFVFDIGVGFFAVGDFLDLAELCMALTLGVDKWGRPVTNLDRAFMLGGVLLPFVSNAAFRSLKNGTRFVDEAAIGLDDWLKISDSSIYSPVNFKEAG